MPPPSTTQVLRAVIQAAPDSAAAEAAKKVIRPLENAGGQLAFRWAALMSAALTPDLRRPLFARSVGGRGTLTGGMGQIGRMGPMRKQES